MTTSCCRMSCSPTCMTATGMGCGSSWAMSWGHIRLHHVSVSLWYQMAVAYSQWIPLLGPALSRLREYSCDRHGAWLSPLGARGWSCWPPADTPRPRSTSTSWCGRAASYGASRSASRSFPGRIRSRFVAWNGCIAWACSAPSPNRLRRVSEGRRVLGAVVAVLGGLVSLGLTGVSGSTPRCPARVTQPLGVCGPASG
jgi:hypothetical protein